MPRARPAPPTVPIGLPRVRGSRGGFWLAGFAGFEVLGYFPAAETRPGRLKIGALEKSNLTFGRVWPGMAPPNTTPRVDQAPRSISSWYGYLDGEIWLGADHFQIVRCGSAGNRENHEITRLSTRKVEEL